MSFLDPAVNSGPDAAVIVPHDAPYPGAGLEDEFDLKVFRSIVEGTAGGVGEDFLRPLVRHLAQSLDVHHAFVTEFLSVERVRTLAFWTRDRFAPNDEWSLSGTPCEDVIRGKLCHYPSGVSLRFPNDEALVAMRIESYLGVPLLDPEGGTLGHLVVFDERPMPRHARVAYIIRQFAVRAVAELQRSRAERQLRESEQRYRDLYEEAPIAYVHEDVESRFVSANRKAIQILGIDPSDVPGFRGISLVPDTPSAQRRVREAFNSVGKGTDTSGVVLELCRKDTGKPVWVQWWSRPEPDGLHTRTMIVDITELVQVKEEKARVEAQNVYLREELKSVHNFEEIIGQSQALSRALDDVRRVAPTEASVLITGETGTGKELIARAIHSNSAFADKPLIKINCAALPASLVESELFGHERGAFSGAVARRIGRFELAHGGTIFLDEIGEVPLEVQAKLLRVLQEREFERLGGSTAIKVRVRVIAATNRDLRRAMREGTFREDLFYRLNVFPIHVPPLRERVGDIPLLVEALVRKFAAKVGQRIEGVGTATMDRLMAYPWPGNVRELENVVERAVILSSEPILEVARELLPGSNEEADPTPALTAPSPEPRAGSLEDVERDHIRRVLERTRWVIEGATGAAKVLDMHPNTLRSRLKKLGLQRPAPHDIS